MCVSALHTCACLHVQTGRAHLCVVGDHVKCVTVGLQQIGFQCKKNGSSGMRSDLPKIRKLAGDGADLNSRPQVPTLTHSLLTESIASNGMNRCSPITWDFSVLPSSAQPGITSSAL